MTDTTQTASTSAAAPAAAESNAAPASTDATSADAANKDTAQDPQDTLASQYGAGEDGKKELSKKDSAQEKPKDDDGDAKPADHDSDDQDAEDTDTDAKDDGEEEGKQEAQKTEYEAFTLPEGLELDSESLKDVLPLFQEMGATQEQAQQMVDVASSMLSKATKAMTDQHNAVTEGWRKETTELFGKEGDAQFKEKVGRAEEVVKQFFGEDQRDVLTHYGLGNHPAFFSMCLAIAEGTGEDRPNSLNAGNGAAGQKTLGQIWYPET